MSDDKTNLYAAMYNTDQDEPISKKPGIAEQSPTQSAKTRKIRVGIVEYEVPTPEYVGRLEALVTAQTQQIQNLLREMRRVEQAMRRLWKHKAAHMPLPDSMPEI